MISSDHDIAMEERKRRIQEKKDKKKDNGMEALRIESTIGGLLQWSKEFGCLVDTHRLASMTFLATASGCTPYSGPIEQQKTSASEHGCTRNIAEIAPLRSTHPPFLW